MFFGITQSCCCDEDTETLYSCTSSGCVEDVEGTLTQKECYTICRSWECTASGCKEREGNSFYNTETECQNACKSWVCVSNGCLQWNNNGGTYNTLEDCLTDPNCQSWKCESNGCTSSIGNGGYLTESECNANCNSYTCTSNTCQLISGSGGEFGTAQECLDSGCEATSWNCRDSGCEEISGSSGEYATEKECQQQCCQIIMCYACLGGGICFETPIVSCNGQTCEDKGYYTNFGDCRANCQGDYYGSGIQPGS